MSVAATVGGWAPALAVAAAGALAAAGAVAATALLAWRTLGTRMESVARACHELRGPIAAARLGLELGSRSGELSAARLRAIDIELGRAALALEDLDGARHGRAGGRSVAPVDLRQLLADSVEAWRPAATVAGKNLRLRWTGAAVNVRGDGLRLAQAVENLIVNAILHGGSAIVVRGGLDERQGAARPVMEVTDDGPGLPAPVAELTRRARGGRGVHGRGLAITASIADAHRGRLAAAPSECGARLVIELPLDSVLTASRTPTHTSRTE